MMPEARPRRLTSSPTVTTRQQPASPETQLKGQGLNAYEMDGLRSAAYEVYPAARREIFGVDMCLPCVEGTAGV
jgi:hypothetical protein